MRSGVSAYFEGFGKRASALREIVLGCSSRKIAEGE